MRYKYFFAAFLASTSCLASDSVEEPNLFWNTQDVEFVQHNGHELLVSSDNNLALYTFKIDDSSHKSSPQCTSKKDELPLGSCLARWPAAITTIEQLSELHSKNSLFGGVYNSDLKALQLTYDSLPLYYWFKDSENNNFTGNGVVGLWSVVDKNNGPRLFNGY
ncbi:hypothetical protein [Vibrio sp. SCSIO 43137]|uniref:hypothetical protein n=1 Tax=Vibrio sp. SCSIO 43137 TaxID=3021011 RepID=UPI00230796DE|nr:hypothetical protein [Vibrio sp. SCSIO 43137]WCE29325.1 hypothetical protein PK654_13495 [Vibrio sp. SCSIO 43137]